MKETITINDNEREILVNEIKKMRKEEGEAQTLEMN